MAKRVGLVFFLVVGFLAGSVLPVNVSAAGTGTQSDPFIVHELTMDARFVSQGAGTLSVNGGGIGSSNYGNKLETDNINLNDGENTISISSDFGCDYCEYFCDVDDCGDCNRCDDCGFSIWNDHVLAVFRIGSDTDGNVIYTQRNGWSVPGGGTINEAPASSCYFWSGSGQTTVDFPWTSNEKCVNTLPSGFADCAYLSLSKTFYVQYIPPCVCSSGPCCDGCNYRPSGSNCGTAACHSDYYYQSGGSCYKADYPTSCTKTCDGSGNCQDCCIPVNSLQTWDCGICRQRNPSSCSGSTGPLCENSPPGTLCNSDSNSCTNDICYSGACTHPAFCSGTDTSCGCTSCSNCNSQDRYYDTSPLNTSWVSTGECTEKEQKQQVYRDYFCSGGTSCVYTTGNIQWIDIGNIRNKADGAQCTTLSGQPGTCSTGTCIPKPTFSVSANLYPSSINVDESTTLSGAVTCLNGDCGSVTVYPKSDQGTSTPPLDAIPGLNVQCNTGIPNCGFSCHTMTLGSSCTPPPSWTITGKNAGTYSMFLRVMSTDSNVLSKDSSTINLNVNEIPFGSISITSFSPDSPVITKDSSTIVRTEITCSGTAAKCGNITLSLSYSPGVGLTVIPGSTSCMELKGGKTCPANWTILGNTLGAYNLYVSAHSDILEVADVMKQIVLTVTDKPVIQISNVNLITPIKKGETAALSAEIKCISSSASCGTVKSSLKHNGTAGSLTIQNPEKNCGIMYAS
ncbi:MAG: hypothetical protein NTY20_04720 [Candidatus Aenigmarchaeota archaeon]|nr:hypothetical protein [Candidatus Aenigmarchaeota archaeon]